MVLDTCFQARETKAQNKQIGFHQTKKLLKCKGNHQKYKNMGEYNHK